MTPTKKPSGQSVWYDIAMPAHTVTKAMPTDRAIARAGLAVSDLAAAEGLGELPALGEALLREPPAGDADADDDDDADDAGWPLGMAMNATIAAMTATPRTRAITQVFGRRRIRLVCTGPESPGPVGPVGRGPDWAGRGSLGEA